MDFTVQIKCFLIILKKKLKNSKRNTLECELSRLEMIYGRQWARYTIGTSETLYFLFAVLAKYKYVIGELLGNMDCLIEMGVGQLIFWCRCVIDCLPMVLI